LTIPGTPSTAASTPHTSVRNLFSPGCSMRNMPTMAPLDGIDSTSGELEVPRKSGSSVRRKRTWNSQDLKRVLGDENNDANTIPPQPADDDVPDESTIGKLRMDSVVGRKEEIKTIKTCLQRMVTAKRSFDKAMKFDSGFLKIPSKELVFIRGCSGVGKTTIARKLSSYVAKSKGGLFVEEKFHAGSKVPFAQIANIFRNVCREILSISEESALHIGEIINTELGDQRDILLCMVPELKEIVVDYYDNNDNDDDSISSTNDDTKHFEAEYAQQRCKYAFRVLSRALSAVVSPLVLLLDDMQWADSASMDFINHLICDEQNPNPFMIVGCYRHDNSSSSSKNDEPNSNSPALVERIQYITDRKDNFRCNITQVELENFTTVDSVKEMIMAIMSMDDNAEQVEGLARICFKRTQGNPYFVVEFMTMLQQKGLLNFSHETLKWSWDENEIIEAKGSTNNIVDMLQARIEGLSVPQKKFLQCAACLGSSFQKSLISLVWKEYYTRNDDDAASVDDLIATLSDQHFFIVEQQQRRGDNGEVLCQWVHDQMREAVAQHLLDGSNKNKSVRPQIGSILLRSLDKEQLEQDYLFMVTDLINHMTQTRIITGKVEFAKLNLRAAKKARDIGAFQSASAYVASGIRMLPTSEKDSKLSNDNNNHHRELMVEFCTMGALMELALGNGEGFEEYSTMVFEQQQHKEESTVEEIETMPLQVSRVNKLSMVDLQYKQAVDYSLATLKDWGTKVTSRRKYNIMMRPLEAMTKLSKTICMAKNDAPAPDDIHDAMGIITDPKLLNTLKLLSHLGHVCWISKQVFLNILVICKIVELTLEHGLNEFAAPAFASLGMLTVALKQDTETGSQFAKLALAIQGQMTDSSSGTTRAETLYIVYTYCLCHTESLNSALVPYTRAYNSGLRVGRNDHAIWALVCKQLLVPWMMGKSMVSLRGHCPDVVSQAEDLSQGTQAVVVKAFWQAMTNLFTSASDGSEPKNVSLLEGKIFSAKNFKGTDEVASAFVHLVQGELLLFFDIEKAADRAVKYGDKFVKDAPAMFIGVMETFHRAVALYAMARRTKKRKYRKRAVALRKRIEDWQDEGNPNIKHYDIFLNAEQAALDNRNELAETRYRRAVVYAARTGHLHHTALFNERYAEFLKNVKGDEYEARHRTNEAVRFYREWGAFVKATELAKEL